MRGAFLETLLREDQRLFWRIVIAHWTLVPLHFSKHNARISRNEDPEKVNRKIDA